MIQDMLLLAGSNLPYALFPKKPYWLRNPGAFPKIALFAGFDLDTGRAILHSVRKECLKYLLAFKDNEHKPS